MAVYKVFAKISWFLFWIKKKVRKFNTYRLSCWNSLYPFEY